jgi:hypothetical protein
VWFKDAAFGGARTRAMTGIECLADGIKAELEQLLPEQRQTQRGKLSLLVATMLDARSANLMDRRCRWKRTARGL